MRTGCQSVKSPITSARPAFRPLIVMRRGPATRRGVVVAVSAGGATATGRRRDDRVPSASRSPSIPYRAPGMAAPSCGSECPAAPTRPMLGASHHTAFTSQPVRRNGAPPRRRMSVRPSSTPPPPTLPLAPRSVYSETCRPPSVSSAPCPKPPRITAGEP